MLAAALVPAVFAGVMVGVVGLGFIGAVVFHGPTSFLDGYNPTIRPKIENSMLTFSFSIKYGNVYIITGEILKETNRP
jgi:hypothetical protein